MRWSALDGSREARGEGSDRELTTADAVDGGEEREAMLEVVEAEDGLHLLAGEDALELLAVEQALLDAVPGLGAACRGEGLSALAVAATVAGGDEVADAGALEEGLV